MTYGGARATGGGGISVSNPDRIFWVLVSCNIDVILAGLPLGVPGPRGASRLTVGGRGGQPLSNGRKKTPTVWGGPSGFRREGVGNMYIYPRRAYNPIVRVDFGSVNPSGVVKGNFFGVPGVSRRFTWDFLLTDFIFDPHNGSVDEQRGRENRRILDRQSPDRTFVPLLYTFMRLEMEYLPFLCA